MHLASFKMMPNPGGETEPGVAMPDAQSSSTMVTVICFPPRRENA
jgi:hypothetical protein